MKTRQFVDGNLAEGERGERTADEGHKGAPVGDGCVCIFKGFEMPCLPLEQNNFQGTDGWDSDNEVAAILH